MPSTVSRNVQSLWIFIEAVVSRISGKEATCCCSLDGVDDADFFVVVCASSSNGISARNTRQIQCVFLPTIKGVERICAGFPRLMLSCRQMFDGACAHGGLQAGRHQWEDGREAAKHGQHEQQQCQQQNAHREEQQQQQQFHVPPSRQTHQTMQYYGKFTEWLFVFMALKWLKIYLSKPFFFLLNWFCG